MMHRFEDIKNAIDDAEDILLITHIQPDGDTLGSSFALKNMLDRMGKHADVCCDGQMPSRYDTLFEGTLINSQNITKAYDLMITLDCADLSRLGKARELFKKAKTTINIDHHITNDKFAKINYIAEASSVGEIIFELMHMMGIAQDAHSAKYIYIAISTDTGNFTYSNTSKKCLVYVSQLVELFSLRDIADILFRRRSLVCTKLISKALSSLETYENGKIAFVTILRSDLEEIGALGTDCENIVDYAREIEETKAAVFFREITTGVKVSLRSKSDIDVSAVAALFGGGGHVNAAGCQAKGKMEDIKKIVLNKLMELL